MEGKILIPLVNTCFQRCLPKSTYRKRRRIAIYSWNKRNPPKNIYPHLLPFIFLFSWEMPKMLLTSYLTIKTYSDIWAKNGFVSLLKDQLWVRYKSCPLKSDFWNIFYSLLLPFSSLIKSIMNPHLPMTELKQLETFNCS